MADACRSMLHDDNGQVGIRPAHRPTCDRHCPIADSSRRRTVYAITLGKMDKSDTADSEKNTDELSVNIICFRCC